VAENLDNLLEGNYHKFDVTNESFIVVCRLTHRFCMLTQSRYSIRGATEHVKMHQTLDAEQGKRKHQI
jgi:hypothetical protein